MPLDSQDITNLLTLALAVSTVWLAVATHSMAKATRDAVAIQAQPFLAVDGLSLGLGQAAEPVPGAPAGISRLALLLSNPGQVLVHYEVESLDVTFNGSKVSAPAFHTRRGVVHPKAQAQFFYPTIAFAETLRPGMSGEVDFKIAYWASLYAVLHVTGRMQYVLQTIEPGRMEWIYLDGPHYA